MVKVVFSNIVNDNFYCSNYSYLVMILCFLMMTFFSYSTFFIFALVPAFILFIWISSMDFSYKFTNRGENWVQIFIIIILALWILKLYNLFQFGLLLLTLQVIICITMGISDINNCHYNLLVASLIILFNISNIFAVSPVFLLYIFTICISFIFSTSENRSFNFSLLVTLILMSYTSYLTVPLIMNLYILVLCLDSLKNLYFSYTFKYSIFDALSSFINVKNLGFGLCLVAIFLFPYTSFNLFLLGRSLVFIDTFLLKMSIDLSLNTLISKTYKRSSDESIFFSLSSLFILNPWFVLPNLATSSNIWFVLPRIATPVNILFTTNCIETASKIYPKGMSQNKRI